MTSNEANQTNLACKRGHMASWTDRISSAERQASGHGSTFLRCLKCDAMRTRKRRLAYVYGISEIEYQKLVDSQQGRCAICWTDFGDKLMVDHDHDTGKVRELLCNSCNVLVGMLESGFTKLAISYLKKHGKEI